MSSALQSASSSQATLEETSYLLAPQEASIRQLPSSTERAESPASQTAKKTNACVVSRVFCILFSYCLANGIGGAGIGGCVAFYNWNKDYKGPDPDYLMQETQRDLVIFAIVLFVYFIGVNLLISRAAFSPRSL